MLADVEERQQIERKNTLKFLKYVLSRRDNGVGRESTAMSIMTNSQEGSPSRL